MKSARPSSERDALLLRIRNTRPVMIDELQNPAIVRAVVRTGLVSVVGVDRRLHLTAKGENEAARVERRQIARTSRTRQAISRRRSRDLKQRHALACALYEFDTSGCDVAFDDLTPVQRSAFFSEADFILERFFVEPR